MRKKRGTTRGGSVVRPAQCAIVSGYTLLHQKQGIPGEKYKNKQGKPKQKRKREKTEEESQN